MKFLTDLSESGKILFSDIKMCTILVIALKEYGKNEHYEKIVKRMDY